LSASDRRSPPTPLSIEVIRRTLGTKIEEDAETIRRWLMNDVEPDFVTIAKRTLPAAVALLDRGSFAVSDHLQVEGLMKAAADPAHPRFRSAVSSLVGLVRDALRPSRVSMPVRSSISARAPVGRKTRP
jgi:hypothetical protein